MRTGPERRVVITGMGAITPLGCGLDRYWAGLAAGANGIGPITRFDARDYTSRIAGEVKDFDPAAYMDRKVARRMDLFTQYAVAASGMALTDGGVDLDHVNRTRVGVIVGSGIGGMITFEEQHTALMQGGPRRVSPFFIPMMIADIAPGQISIVYGLKGPNYAVTSACATASHAVGDAFRMVQRGDADLMVAGGAEATVTPMGIGGFCSMKALSTRNDAPQRASRPFDAQRDGFVMGEGAGIVLLEALDHALARGARIYAEMGGIGFTADAYHLTAPDPEGDGAYRSMKAALDDAGVPPESVDYINAHGTSTEYNDRIETQAIKRLFGDHARRVAISSTKSMTGHLLGASGGIELVATTLAMQHDMVPPTINYEFPDPACDLNYTPNQAAGRTINMALSNTFGFGGHNATILVKKYTA